MRIASSLLFARRAGVLICLGIPLLGGALSAQGAAPATGQATWARALDQLRSGDTAAALPQLERLVSANPGNRIYRFELARALSRLNRNARARYHLDQVRGASLSPRERDLVERLDATLAGRRSWSGYFSFRLRPETNGSRQTQDPVVVIGGRPFSISDTAVGKSTVSTVIRTGFRYAPAGATRIGAQVAMDAYVKHNDDRSLRDYQLAARPGVSIALNPRGRVTGGLLLGTRRAGNRPYSETFGLYFNHTRKLGAAGRVHLGGELSRTFRRDDTADIDRHLLFASYTRAIGGTTRVTLSGFAETNDSAQQEVAGLRSGIAFSGLHAFEGGLVAGVTLRGETADRRGVSRVFGRRRSDRTLAAELSLLHRNIRVGAFAPEIRVGIERNRSNIPLADYTNRTLSLGFRLSF